MPTSIYVVKEVLRLSGGHLEEAQNNNMWNWENERPS